MNERIAPSCAECPERGTLVMGTDIYPHRPDLHHKKFYRCVCGAYVGTHAESGLPLGTMAGPLTRMARQNAHAAFDPIWKEGYMKRGEAYARMEKILGTLGTAHIGNLSCAMANKFAEAASKLYTAQRWRRPGKQK